ncbi:MAG: integrase core domain-containing protein [Nanoarchaeota archaeon]
MNTSKTGKHNVKIERFFRNIKERTQLMYWFKNFRSANAILDGYVIWYNFVRNHMTLGKTPVEEAGFSLDLGKNKWKKLIEIATIIKNHAP